MSDLDQEAARLALLALHASMAAQDKLTGQFSYARRMELTRMLRGMADELETAVAPPQRLADALPRTPFSASGP